VQAYLYVCVSRYLGKEHAGKFGTEYFVGVTM
jgi:hypothetical protein